eukprot:gene11901-18356_t
MPKEAQKKRCSWAKVTSPEYLEYHDLEWGRPVRGDDRKLFEMLVLEGAQAGLSWECVLKKRPAFRQAFHNFDPTKVARMTDRSLEARLQNPRIIRNRLKVFSARKNAIAFLAIQQEFGSFSKYLWDHVSDKPITNKWRKMADVPTKTPLSDTISKDLKKRGMSFVGSTI